MTDVHDIETAHVILEIIAMLSVFLSYKRMITLYDNVAIISEDKDNTERVSVIAELTVLRLFWLIMSISIFSGTFIGAHFSIKDIYPSSGIGALFILIFLIFFINFLIMTCSSHNIVLPRLLRIFLFQEHGFYDVVSFLLRLVFSKNFNVGI